jgi:hypothetical protein
VEGLGTAAVASANVGPIRDELSGDIDVVRESCNVKSSVMPIHLGLALIDEELITTREASGSHWGPRRERRPGRRAVAGSDGEEQSRELTGFVHAAR